MCKGVQECVGVGVCVCERECVRVCEQGCARVFMSVSVSECV